MIDVLYRKRIGNISVKEDSEGFHTTIFLTKK